MHERLINVISIKFWSDVLKKFCMDNIHVLFMWCLKFNKDKVEKENWTSWRISEIDFLSLKMPIFLTHKML